MRTIVRLAAVLLLASVAWCQSGASPGSPASPTQNSATNPFGLMLPWAWDQPEKAAQFAEYMHVSSYRPLSMFLDRPLLCAECQSARGHRLDLVITLRANGQGRTNPTTPPADMTNFKNNVTAIASKWQPILLVIENEPDSPVLYNGTVQQYLAELKAGCDAAHVASVPCADGGISSRAATALAVKDLLDSGRRGAAVSLAQRTLGAERITTENQLRAVLARFSGQLERAEEILKGLADAGSDYVNFHWYESDPAALKEVVAYLRRATSLPVITNELGQRNDDATETTLKLQTVADLGLELAVWYSNDADEQGTRALINPDGSLRPTGIAFRDFMLKHYARRPAGM